MLRLTNFLFQFCFVWLICTPSFAQNDSSSKVSFLQSRAEIDLNPFSINPDAPVFKFSKTGGCWENMMGSKFGLIQYGQKNKIELNGEGFIELHDFQPNMLMSSQLWRASFGFEAKGLLQTDSKFSYAFSVGWHHESDHVTDVVSYEDYFLYPTQPLIVMLPYSNSLFRSFEYFKFGIEARWKATPKLDLGVILFAKYFPVPIAGESIYKLRYGFSGEVNGSFHLFPFLDIYGATFLEQIQNDFVSVYSRYKNERIGVPLMSWYSETGIALVGKNKTRFHVFLRYRNSYGRGMDFNEFYREWGGGIKIVI